MVGNSNIGMGDLPGSFYLGRYVPGTRLTWEYSFLEGSSPIQTKQYLQFYALIMPSTISRGHIWWCFWSAGCL